MPARTVETCAANGLTDMFSKAKSLNRKIATRSRPQIAGASGAGAPNRKVVPPNRTVA
jgi:hypothetical protein